MLAVAFTAYTISIEVSEVRAVKYRVIDNEVELEFVIHVVNNGVIDIELDKVYYEVYIEGEYLGYGEKENIIIHRGENNLVFTLKTTPKEVVKTMLIGLLEKEVEVTVKGKVVLPIKSFGLIRIWSVEIPFEKTKVVTLVKS